MLPPSYKCALPGGASIRIALAGTALSGERARRHTPQPHQDVISSLNLPDHHVVIDPRMSLPALSYQTPS